MPHQDVELLRALGQAVAHRRRHLVTLREQLLRLVLRNHRLEHLRSAGAGAGAGCMWCPVARPVWQLRWLWPQKDLQRYPNLAHMLLNTLYPKPQAHLIADGRQHALIPVGAQVLHIAKAARAAWHQSNGAGHLHTERPLPHAVCHCAATSASSQASRAACGPAPLLDGPPRACTQHTRAPTRKILGSCSTSGLDSTRSVMFTICRSAGQHAGGRRRSEHQ